MVTFAQAQERAEEWVNGDVPAYLHREVRVREFELGFVVWAEDRPEGPRSDGGAQRLVIARDSGEATLWPALPVGEVIRRYEEEYGAPQDAVPAPPSPPARVDLNQTSFLLSPPEWLQEAADKLGIPDRRGEAGGDGAGTGTGGSVAGGLTAGAAGVAAGPSGAGATGLGATGGGGSGAGVSGGGVSGGGASGDGAGAAGGTGGVAPDPSLPQTQAGVPGSGPAETRAGSGAGSAVGDGSAWPSAGDAGPSAGDAGPGASGAGPSAGGAASGAPGAPAAGASVPGAPAVPPGATPWTGTDTNADAADDRSVPLPATVFAPPLSGSDDEGAPPVAPADAKTALMSGGSQLPPTAVAPALRDFDQPGTAGPSGAPSGVGAPGGVPGAPGAGTAGAPGGAGGAGASGGTGAPGAHGSQGAGAVYVPGHTPPPSPPAYGYPGAPGAGVPAVPGAPQTHTPPPAPPAAPSYGYPQGAGAPGTPPAGAPQDMPAPGRPLAPNAGDIADAATSKAAPPPRRGRGGTPPPPPSAPGAPGARPGGTPPPSSAPGVPGGSAGGYVPTQLVSALGPDGPEGAPDAPGAPGTPGAPGAPQPPSAPSESNTPGGTPPGGVHHAATVLADPSQMGAGAGAGGGVGGGAPQPPGAPGAPGAPNAPGAPQPPAAPGAPHAPGVPGVPGAPAAAQPPGVPNVPGAPAAPAAPGGGRGAVHHAETVLAAPPVGGPGAPPPPPGAPGAPGAPGTVPGAPQPTPPGVPGPGRPPSYGYPQQPTGQPTVGPGYQAVLRYRAQDGSEQQVIRRSAPGTPHPEWQIFHELRAMNVPPNQVLELHTELESCELPGAYCARMIREQWPQARITSIAPYGTDHASRQQGMRQLLAHQGELHQVADGPARPAPVRAPLPPVQPAPPLPPEAIAQELAAAFGPGIFRFEQAAVSRQGVPPVVAHTLVVAGLPTDMGPFFWAQAQPGRPVPTLAELAQERGVQPASDAGSYLVMGSDFGRAVCVQYGTANIVAVPVEAGPGGAPVAPQFVNTGLPEFQRCLALLGRMWRLRFGLNQEQAGRWTVDFQAQLAALDPAALGSPESWWSVLLEQMWDGLL
ncbi:SUKH-4 family immunity protein [Streptomyces sp. bgisy159]|uniref:SUKH-4 family immunity protein n=1 Tax=Streptomyces sp. bgisy159 TaxID=3413795 RepID=UPI003F4A25EF